MNAGDAGGSATGYSAATYGEAWVDVYDDRYGGTEPAVIAGLIELANGGEVLELGVGTGRLALALAAAGLTVTGLDVSASMLDVLRAKPQAHRLSLVLADMAGPLPSGPFQLVFVAFNTFFGLVSEHDQRRCFHEVAACLAPDGAFVIEAFVPDADITDQPLRVRRMSVDRVLLVATEHDRVAQTAFSQEIEFVDGQPPRMRPTLIRYAFPEQLDAYATDAGLSLAHRWSNWAGDAFETSSTQHVSIWRRSSQSAK